MVQKPRIAILFSAPLADAPGGLVNSVLSRARALKSTGHFEVDVICLEYRPSRLASLLYGRRQCAATKSDNLTVNGLTIRVIRLTNSSAEDVLNKLTGRCNPLAKRKMHRVLELLKKYNLVSAHSHVAAEFALEARRLLSIPCAVTWHGSDIMIVPDSKPRFRPVIVNALKTADANIFVSKALLECAADKVGEISNPAVLYNGASSLFSPSVSNRDSRCRHVGFAGNLSKVKGADMLPDIFQAIKSHCSEKVTFFVAGDGSLNRMLHKRFASDSDLDCTMLGAVSAESMAGFYASIDLLVVPSRSEGLPLVCIEALRCGVNVVGAHIGGIPEIIGDRFTVNGGPDFIERFARKSVEVLESHPLQPVPDDMDWQLSAKREANLYEKLTAKQ